MNFSEKLKFLREEIGLTQTELAEKLGGSNNRHVSMLETGKYNPSSETLKKLGKIFNVSTDYLLFDDVPRSSAFHAQYPEIFEAIDQLVSLEDQEAINSIKNLVKAAVFKAKVQQATKG